MSTHRITPDTKIPFPCWLWDKTEKGWRWREEFQWSPALLQFYTHYSTNPPDRRPEDVDETASTPLPTTTTAIARQAAKIVASTDSLFDGKLSIEEWNSALAAIIAGAMEQHTQSATAALRAENDKLRAENDKLRAELLEAKKSLEEAREAKNRYKASFSGEVAAHLKTEERLGAELTARRDRERLDHVLNAIRKHGTSGLSSVYAWSAEYPLDRAAIDAAMEGQP